MEPIETLITVKRNKPTIALAPGTDFVALKHMDMSGYAELMTLSMSPKQVRNIRIIPKARAPFMLQWRELARFERERERT